MLTTVLVAVHGRYYNVAEDMSLIKEYRKEIDDRPTDHAKVARNLVHNSDWAAVGTISVDSKVPGFPMVNVISVADSKEGVIYFMLVDLDFTGQDWHKKNNVTFLFTQDVNGECRAQHKDPMEPTCARAMISGSVISLAGTKEQDLALPIFLKRHPAGANWIQTHNFYLCKLNIENIYVLDFYGGPHQVTAEDYYKASLYEEEANEIVFKFPARNINKRYKITMEI